MTMNANKISRLFPNASSAFKKINSDPDCEPSSAIIEQGTGEALHATCEVKARSVGRCRVSFTCYRVRKQDPDNAVVKWFVDALRRAGILEDDTEEDEEVSTTPVEDKEEDEEEEVA